MYQFNLYAFPHLISAIVSFGIGLFSYLKNKKSEVNFSFFILAISATLWQFGTFMVLMSIEEKLAFMWCKFVYIGALFIPVSTFHMVSAFLGLEKKYKKLVGISYLISLFLFLPLSQTSYFIGGVYKYFWGYWFKAGILHPLFLLFFGILVSITFYELFKGIRNTTGFKRLQTKYLLVAFLFAYTGVVDYLPDYGIKIYPFGYLSVITYVMIVAYAILKYRLMDINILLTRLGLFILVYFFILGLPFMVMIYARTFIEKLGYYGMLIPLLLGMILASIGPFVYNSLRKQAEELLLAKQRHYQKVLLQAATTMVTEHNLLRLCRLIVENFRGFAFASKRKLIRWISL